MFGFFNPYGIGGCSLSCFILKQVLRSCVISKEGSAGISPANTSFGMADYEISSVRTTEYNSIVIVIPNEGLAGLVPAKPSFGMTRTAILRPVLVRHGSFTFAVIL